MADFERRRLCGIAVRRFADDDDDKNLRYVMACRGWNHAARIVMA